MHESGPLFLIANRKKHMGKEIERKFLVSKDSWKKLDLLKKVEIHQGYLHTADDLTLRIRLSIAAGLRFGDAFITIKTNTTGITRDEYEYKIPYEDGKQLIKKAPAILKKVRNYVRDEKNQLWEIDVFQGKNRGLVMAEIELKSAREHVSIPAWLGREVSTDPLYMNTSLIATKAPTK